MMMGTEIRRELQAVIDQRVAANETVRLSWLVKQVLADHDVSAFDDFLGYCANATVTREAGAVIRKMKGGEADEVERDRQAVLPGFARLQVRYVFERDNEQIVVPLELMTNEEVDAKADELEAMADGCRIHALELRDYLRQRSEKAKAS